MQTTVRGGATKARIRRRLKHPLPARHHFVIGIILSHSSRPVCALSRVFLLAWFLVRTNTLTREDGKQAQEQAQRVREVKANMRMRHIIHSCHAYLSCLTTCTPHVRHTYPTPPTYTHTGAAYLAALTSPTGLPAGTPGLLLWDVVNEPETGGDTNLPGERPGK